MSASLKALHDRLLAERPDGAEHDEATCPLCALELAGGSTTDGGPEGGSMSTFTQEDVDTAVKKAVDEATAAANARLAELEAAQQETEVGKAVAEATAPLNEQISDLQRQLDEAKIAQAAAEEAKAAVDAFWENAIAEHEQAEEIAARKDERLEELKKVAPEGAHAYLEENIDRFAAMADDEFQARIEEYRLLSGKQGSNEEIPATTSLTAAREGAGGTQTTKPGSMLSVLPSLRRTLTDPRTL